MQEPRIRITSQCLVARERTVPQAIALQRKRQLQALERVAKELEEAQTLDAVKQIRDRAAAVRVYAQQAQLGLELQNKAAEVKLRAERKAGRLLKSLKLRGGDRKSNGHRDRLKLSELGLTANQSKRWQKEASVSDIQFEQFVADANRLGIELTSARLLRHARDVAQNDAARSNGGDGHSGQCGRRQENVTDVAEEIINHCNIVTSILRPIWEPEANFRLREIERRTLKRLLGEVLKLAAGLRRSGSHETPTS